MRRDKSHVQGERSMRSIFVAVCALGMIAGLGCSPASDVQPLPQAETPEQVADRVMQAASSKDEDAFMAILTTKARESLSSGDNGSFGGQEYDSYEVGEPVIDGAEASVPVSAVKGGEPENVNLKMRQEDGAWRLYAMGMVVGPDTEMTVNFENIGQMMQELTAGLGDALGEALTSTMENAFQSGSPEEIALKLAMFDALEPVDAAVVDSSWKLAENVQGKPRTEALSGIAESIDLSIHVGDHADVLSETVGIDTNEMSKLEAIERIANEAGLYTVLPNLQDWGIATAFMDGMADAMGALIGGEDSIVTVEGPGAEAALDNAMQTETPADNAITFTADAPAASPLFLGPFRLDLTKVEENVPHTTGNLQLQLTAHGLPPAVLSMMETHEDSFQIQEVVAPDGSPLIDMDMSYMGGGGVVGTAYHDTTSRELSGLLRSVDRIARITGMVELPRPTSMEALDFSTMVSGGQQTAGDLTVSVDKMDAFASLKVTGPEDVVESLVIYAQAYGPDGEPVMAHYSDYQSWQPGEGTFSMNLDETPSRVQLKIVLAADISLFPFAFTAVPLLKAAEQPEQLTALDFGVHPAPLKLTFVEITKRDSNFSEAKVSIENVSNKLPQSVFVDFVYLDGSGKELDSFPHTINGSFSSDGWSPLAKPGEKVDTDQTAFQMPENTQSISFRLNHVEFMDGTKWEPEA